MTNDSNNDRNDFATITVADIEALRTALGAEAELQGVAIDTSTQAAPRTGMCPSHPWDN